MDQVPTDQYELFDENTKKSLNELKYLYSKLQNCINNFESEGNRVIDKLIEEREPIQQFHTASNYARTATTISGVAGSALTITGIAFAPVTFGGSLALTGVGVGLAVGAAAATGTVEVNDHLKTKKFVKQLQTIYEELENPRLQLCEIVKIIEIEITNMKSHIYTQFGQSIDKIRMAEGIVVNGGRLIQTTVGTACVGLSIGTKSLKATKVASNVVEGSQAIGGTVKVAEVASSTGGKVLQSASPLLMGLSAGFGVAFATLDIGLLIYSWSKDHSAENVINNIIKMIIAEINEHKSYLKELEDICLIRCNEILWQKFDSFIEYSNKRERFWADKIQMWTGEFKEEFEGVKSQMKQEADESELRMKIEAEERDSRMKKESDERDKRNKLEAEEKDSKMRKQFEDTQKQITDITNMVQELAKINKSGRYDKDRSRDSSRP